jgi:hypothetical protein
MRLRLLVLFAVLVTAGTGALAVPARAAECSGDYCTAFSPFDVLTADIAANAPPRLVRLFTAEAGLAQAFHPPSPCIPGSCVASQLVLIGLDLQIRSLPTRGCPGGCGFTTANAYVLDHDIRGILADPTVYTAGLQMFPPGPPTIPPGPSVVPGA